MDTLPLPAIAVAGRTPNLLKSETLVLALVASALFWLLAWYWDTALSAIAIWRKSDTFAHGWLIAPISGWLIWTRRHVLATLELRPNFLALPVLALVGFGWLLARLAEVGVAQQFTLVLMIPLMVWAILGNQIVRALAFPLFFLLFAVPFGDFLEPPLMEHSANFVIAALRLTGIPVYREGLYFMIPTGSWSVVEACSGLRYLIASVTLGLLYAYLTYRSWSRRALFIAAAFIVPIVANWLRAYMIVMIGHLSGMKYAVGVDHLLYGWVFFGVVMLLLFWIGSFWREDVEGSEAPHTDASRPRRVEPSLGALAAATVAAAAMVAAWPLAAARIDEIGAYGTPVLNTPPAAGQWRPVDGRLSNWTPRFVNLQPHIAQAYSDGTRGVGLLVVYYRYQRPYVQVVSRTNTLVSGHDREWRSVGESGRTLVAGRDELQTIEASLRSRAAQLLVWRWNWIDGQYVTSPYWTKLLQAKSKLLGRGDDGAIVMVYALAQDDPEVAERTLQDFVRDMLPGITSSLEYARRTRPAS